MAGSFQTAGELDGMRGGPTAGELRTDGAADRGRGAGRSPRGGRLAGLPEGVAVEADRIEMRFAGAEDDRPVRWLFGSRREPASGRRSRCRTGALGAAAGQQACRPPRDQGAPPASSDRSRPARTPPATHLRVVPNRRC